MEAKTAAGLSVLLALLGIVIAPLIFFLIEKDSAFVRFHSMQALVLCGVMYVLGVAGGVLAVILVGFLFWLLIPVVWVFLLIQTIKAFNGETYYVPFIGKLAAQWAGQVKV